MGTILLSLLSGGGLAIVPHLLDMSLDFFKQRQANAHEIVVLGLQIQQQKELGVQRLEEVKITAQSAFDVAQESRLAASAQPTGVKWVDALTASMRPAITILVVANYVAYKWNHGMVWGEDDMGMVITILIYWFGDRSLSKMRAA